MGTLFKRMLGIVYVEQKNDIIEIGGVATQSLTRDIQATWGTSKIHNNMFTDFGRRSLSFKQFYALEVHYMLQRLLKNRRNWTSRNTIISAIKQLEENTWLAGLQEGVEVPKILDRSKLSLFHKTPLPHQAEFFDVYEKGRARLGLLGFLLAAGAGSGKTLTDLMIAEMVHSDFVIVVSPNNAVYRVWKKAIAGLDGEGCEFKKPQSIWIAGENQPYKGQRYLVTHFEGLEKLVSVAKGIHGKITVILDESHNFNEMKSNRTNSFIQLCHDTKSENIIWASGTPIKALGGESIPLLKTIDPMFDAQVEASFKQIFGINAQRALDILRNRMGYVNFRVEKSEVVDNKPTEEAIKITLPNGADYTLSAISTAMSEFITQRMDYYKKNYASYEAVYENCITHFEEKATSDQRAQLREYRRQVVIVKKNPDPRFSGDEMKFCNEFELKQIMPTLNLEDRKAFKGAKSVIKYVNLKVMGEALGSVLGKARSRLHVEMLDHIPFEEIMAKAEKKTVVFTSYVEVVKRADVLFRNQGLKPMLVFGETNKNLATNVGAFEKDPSVDPLVATFPSLSTAVPLVMADQEIFLNVPFRDHELVQAKARVDRLGQDTPVKFVFVYLDTGKEPNISTRSKEILDWSKQQVAMIMGQDYNGEAAQTMDGYIASLESFDEPSPSVLDFEEALNDVLDSPLE
jgi:hypothetical protein